MPVHAKKMTECGLMSRERSMSRVASKQTPPELVSQFRELMRHEKELIGLNYHLENLEKEMASEGRGEGRA